MSNTNPKIFQCSKAEVQFCTLVARGDKPITECLKIAFPKYRKAAANSVYTQAKRMCDKPHILAKIADLKIELASALTENEADLKAEMVERLVNGIRKGTDGDPLTIVDFVPAIKQLGKMLGWEMPTDINVRNGGVTADYKGPPTLMTMTDEELDARIKKMMEGK